jgi:hypothetical protein
MPLTGIAPLGPASARSGHFRFYPLSSVALCVFKQKNPLLIAPVDPRLSQVVRSTPLGIPCSELQ